MRLSLTRHLFLLNTVLLAAAVAAVGVLWFTHHQRVVQEDGEERAMTMARSVAAMPPVREGLESEDPTAQLAPMAETMREASGFEYIVVADSDGIRHSHPVPEAIGQPTGTDPSAVLAGELWTSVEQGPAGLTLRARAPVFSEEDEVIGYVSVGILTSDIDGTISEALPVILGTLLTAVLLGAVGAYVISRRIRSRTHGLEPAEITELLDSREALLYAISEGVVAVDQDGRIILANAAARELLGLDSEDIGRRPHETALPRETHHLLAGERPAGDELLAVGHRILVCSRRPVHLRRAAGGAVITLRDQTALAQLTGELDGARTVTRGLRAQRHEFANRIHTVAGMLELGGSGPREGVSDRALGGHRPGQRRGLRPDQGPRAQRAHPGQVGAGLRAGDRPGGLPDEPPGRGPGPGAARRPPPHRGEPAGQRPGGHGRGRLDGAAGAPP